MAKSLKSSANQIIVFKLFKLFYTLKQTFILWHKRPEKFFFSKTKSFSKIIWTKHMFINNQNE